MTRGLHKQLAALLCLALFSLGLVSCGSGSNAPPRAEDPIIFEPRSSTVEVNIDLNLDGLARHMEGEIPRTLWSITRKDIECVPPKTVDLALFDVKTPKINCDIEGEVTRGRIRVSGRDRLIIATIPIDAELRAKDIGGVLKQETGTASAEVEVALQVSLSPGWSVASSAEINYRWTKEPGVDFLGQRIRFTSAADKELRPLEKKIEGALTSQLAALKLREGIERGWKKAHTVFILNERNPPVWGRITPQRVRSGGYEINGNILTLALGMDAQLETYVGNKPEAPIPGPLPDLAKLDDEPGESVLYVPVFADYEVLEPVIMKALKKRSIEPFEVEDFGSITADFKSVEFYGTEDGKAALGVKFSTKSDRDMIDDGDGKVWLVGRPVNEINSREVGFEDISVAGDTNLVGQKVLFALVNSGAFQDTIADALKQSFENDYEELLGKIDVAIAERQDGPLAYSVEIDEIRTGEIKAFGQGLFLPVELEARMKARLVKPKD